ncbi:hypothetical protein [Rhodopirellula islandica]|uniref:hypothetical protein n=1 Tax=Rhodopirellula islandica TaxID=595434 RepID=UPI001F304C54|nr:hypothetical protein [Rhodopirellula islandica]
MDLHRLPQLSDQELILIVPPTLPNVGPTGCVNLCFFVHWISGTRIGIDVLNSTIVHHPAPTHDHSDQRVR